MPATGETTKTAYRQFLVFREAFKNQLCRGFDQRAIAQELARRNLLERGDARNLTKKEPLPNEGRVRVYVISGRILDDDEDESDRDGNIA